MSVPYRVAVPDTIGGHKLLGVTPFLRQRDAFDFAPDVIACVIKHDDLQPSLVPNHLFAKRLENRADGRNILVANTRRWTCVIMFDDAREVDLTGLVIDQKAGNGMIDAVQEEALKGNGDGNVIGEPIGTASDLLQIVRAFDMNDLQA